MGYLGITLLKNNSLGKQKLWRAAWWELVLLLAVFRFCLLLVIPASCDL